MITDNPIPLGVDIIRLRPTAESRAKEKYATLEAALEQYTGPRLGEKDPIPEHIIVPNGDIHPAIIAFKLASNYSFPNITGGEPVYVQRKEDGWFVQRGYSDLDPQTDSRNQHLVRLLSRRAAVVGLTKIGQYHHPENRQRPPGPHQLREPYWAVNACLGWVYTLAQEDIKTNLQEKLKILGRVSPVGAGTKGGISVDLRTFLKPGDLVACVDHVGFGRFEYQLLKEDLRTPAGQKGLLYPVKGFTFIGRDLTDKHGQAPVPAIAIIDPNKI